MYIQLLDIAIELGGFLSDIKHPENLELVSSTVLQLDKERCRGISEHNRHVQDQHSIIYEDLFANNRRILERHCAVMEAHRKQRDDGTLVRAMIEDRQKQTADRTLTEDEIDDMSDDDCNSQKQVANGTMVDYLMDELEL